MPKRRTEKSAAESFDVELCAERVRAEFERLRGRVAGVDDGDLLLILQAKLRPRTR